MNFTQFPNQLLDKMADFDATEWRVLCVIVRKIEGFQKDSDVISLSQFQKATGIKGRQHIISAIARLQEKHGVISRQKVGLGYEYRLTSSNAKLPSSNVELPAGSNGKLLEGSNVELPRGNVELPEVVTQSNTQKKEESIKNNGGVNDNGVYAHAFSDEDNQPTTAEKLLMSHFTKVTAFPPSADQATYRKEWLIPIQAIRRKANNDLHAEELIDYGIERMREKDYTIKSPKSILTFALNYNAPQKTKRWKPA